MTSSIIFESLYTFLLDFELKSCGPLYLDNSSFTMPIIHIITNISSKNPIGPNNTSGITSMANTKYINDLERSIRQ